MSSIKTTHFTDETAIAATPECPICYEPIGSVDFCITKCGHRFHTSCIIKASKFRSNCPYCRTSITTDSSSEGPSQQVVTDSDMDELADERWRVLIMNPEQHEETTHIPENVLQELNRVSESRRRQQSVLNQSLIEIGVINITSSDILINDNDEDDEDLVFVPVVSRLIERGRNNRCGLCRQIGHNRRNCVFRGSFV